MSVRLSAEWMVKADDRVLEFLETEGPYSPTRIARDGRITFGRQHINDRLRVLDEAGLAQKSRLGRGVYEISDKGERYLTGDFDARELPDPDE